MSTQTKVERLVYKVDVEIFVTMEDLKQDAAVMRRLKSAKAPAKFLVQSRINGMGEDREAALRAEVERLEQSAQKAAAIKTLESLGYTYNGGEKWRPPIGKRPDWLDAEARTAPEPLTLDQIDKAAMKLAECMDYPWAQMPEQGKRSMRSHAKAVIDASGITKGNT